MPELSISLIVSSFIAGLLTFFAPCTLPLIPAFLGIMSGIGAEEWREKEKTRRRRWRIFYHALWFVLGFSLIFIAFGLTVSWVSALYGFKKWAQWMGGIFIFLLGLGILGIIPGWKGLFSSLGGWSGKLVKPGKAGGAFATGMLFALGWSPCVGPLVGSILLLASSTGTVTWGVLLLAIFSLGLALPFLVTAFLLDKAVVVFERWSGLLKAFNRIVGLFLLLLGILMVAGHWTALLSGSRGFLERLRFYEIYVNQFL